MIYNELFPTINNINAKGQIRTFARDFKVVENLSVDFSNQGEHLWLYIEKTDSNTNWVAKQLSNVCQVPQKNIGFAGLKDRHAITRQWFSIQLAKISDIDKIQAALPNEIRIIQSAKHHKKIKTGQLDGNNFSIKVRNIKGDKQQIEQNIANIQQNGVPNYFGEQRFGHDMGNIKKASDWFTGNYKVKTRNLKSILISTARSHIFNLIISKRIEQNIWNKAIKGDILQLNNSKSWFEEKDASKSELEKRLSDFDIHITAAMWGENPTQASDKCAKLETEIAQQFPNYQRGFEKFRLKQDRRAMRIIANNLQHNWHNDNLVL
ncbi:MAG TPA: tRNA pseudouridine(13) synthase TruD, partial [Oceanospirillales bacterium]|nr:tRNA pseudouridine(13) synthase TruD [Oceanospirillales bacterium]